MDKIPKRKEVAMEGNCENTANVSHSLINRYCADGPNTINDDDETLPVFGGGVGGAVGGPSSFKESDVHQIALSPKDSLGEIVNDLAVE